MRIKGKKSLAPLGALALPLLAACASAPPTEFTGPLIGQSGVCDPPGRAVLTLHDEFVQFAPEEGSLTLTGRQDGAGAISASWHPPSAPAGAAGWRLQASLRGTTIDGSYITPRCTYALHLTAAGR